MAEVDFKGLLRNAVVILQSTAGSKEELIAEMVGALAERGMICDRDRTLAAVMKRERSMSTGMQHGVAIPHAKTDTTDSLAVAICVKKEGIDFNSLDRLPSNIIVLTISSVFKTGPHISFLAEIGRLLERQSVRARVLAAATAADVAAILAESDQAPEAKQ
jgi:PTS system nitrogen regulatory IIA component